MTSEKVDEETVGFISENAGYEAQFQPTNDASLSKDSIDKFYLKDFLSRPVKILSFQWPETDAVGTIRTVEPWYALFNDSRIKSKLNNFAFLRASLRIKIVINASPFYYGAMLAYYTPLNNFNENASIAQGTGNEWLVTASQRPHVWIYPQGNQGAEMKLPYFNYRNWTRTSLINDFKDLGLLTFVPYTQLQSANGVSGVGVTVTVFAWAEDVEVSGATVGLALAQAGDEYTGSISKPSSKISNAFSLMSDIPILGPFAKATSIGVGAIGKIAHIFGYTNTPVLSDVTPYQPRPFHNLADSSIGYPVDKLTLDSKNELGISSKLLGVDEQDPLIIKNFIERESYLTTATWTTTNQPDDILFSANVEPTLCAVDSSTIPIIYSTPMSYAAALFNQWRGDIVFRFHFICSQFHKGRVRVQWDPAGYTAQNVISDSNAYSGCFNEVVDLGKDTNVEFRIPFLQATPFLTANQFGVSDFSTSTSPSFTYDPSKHNGTIVVRCVTSLTAPIASSEIQILVSVRSASVEFANPSFYASESMEYSLMPAQGGFEYDDSAEVIEVDKPSIPADHLYITFMGEQVLSLRQLLKRACLIHEVFVTTTSQNYATTLGLYRIPHTFGYTQEFGACYQAVSLVTPPDPKGFNWTKLNPITWLTPCFIGQRGSVNYTVNCQSGTSNHHNMVVASRRPHFRVQQTAIYDAYMANGSNGIHMKDANGFYPGPAGMTVQCSRTNAGLEFQVPNYSQYQFQRTMPYNANTPSDADGSVYDTFRIVLGKTNSLDFPNSVFAGAGPDFNLVFFLNAPPVYHFPGTPTPA